jgi:Pyridoxamine 5'-phosphate oxidase
MSNSVEWADVLARLAPVRNYWLSTVGRDGGPHAVPVWGAALDGTLYLYSARTTVKARNLAADPRAVIHLESGDDVTIVHGTLHDVGQPGDVPAVVRALAGKYTRPEDVGYLPSSNPHLDVVYALRPRLALMWRLDDMASYRRWTG